MGSDCCKEEPPEPSQEAIAAATYRAGPPVEYGFVNFNVKRNVKLTFFKYLSVLTTNLDEYYPALRELLARGFQMKTFSHLPPGMMRHLQIPNLFIMQEKVSFQGIFVRYPTAPRNEIYQLQIERSVVEARLEVSGVFVVTSKTVADTNHLNEMVKTHADNGGRFIGFAYTGHQKIKRGGMRSAKPVMGVDLFFEHPTGPVTEYYKYKVVTIPVDYNVKGGFYSMNFKMKTDWKQYFHQYLSQGWKLIDIFFDMGATTGVEGRAMHIVLDSQWYFEKPAARAYDTTPIYEGFICDHYVKIKRSGLYAIAGKANWEPVLETMGRYGWELACFVESPELIVKGGHLYMKMLLFFQRKLEGIGFASGDSRDLDYVHESGGAYGFSNTPPPPYEYVKDNEAITSI